MGYVPAMNKIETHLEEVNSAIQQVTAGTSNIFHLDAEQINQYVHLLNAKSNVLVALAIAKDGAS